MSKNKCEWEWKKLGEICNSINGLWKGKKEPFVKVCVIRNTNFTKDCKLNLDADKLEILDVEKKQYASRKLQYGDLIIEKSGGSEKQPVGRAILFEEIKGEYSFSNFTSVLRIKDSSKISCHFLHRQLYKLYLDGVTKSMQPATTGIHNLEFDKYKQLDIAIPPLAEQERIVNVLDDAFAKIDKIKTDAETNLQNAKDLFQTTLANELSITDEKIKQGWKSVLLKDVCLKIVDGTHHSPVNTPKGDYQYITAKNIKSYGIDLSDVTYVSEDVHREIYSRCNPEKDDILLIKDGATTGIAVINTLDYEFSLLSSVALLKLDKKEIFPGYLAHMLNSDEMYKQMRKKMDGAAITRLTLEKIKLLQVFYPPLSIQKQIVAKLDSLSEKVKQLESNYKQVIADCDELKKSILKKAFEGNL